MRATTRAFKPRAAVGKGVEENRITEVRNLRYRWATRTIVGKGVEENRITEESGAYRVIYVARIETTKRRFAQLPGGGK
jgi:hypothetical protein